MKKDKKLFHKLLDIVMDKGPESAVKMNVSSLNSTADVWFFEIRNNGTFETFEVKKHYNRYGDGWEKWENGKTEYATDEDVLEALRNA